MEAKFDAVQWVVIIATAAKVGIVRAAAREVVEVPMLAETVFIELKVVVADATAMSTKPACYSVA